MKPDTISIPVAHLPYDPHTAGFWRTRPVEREEQRVASERTVPVGTSLVTGFRLLGESE